MCALATSTPNLSVPGEADGSFYDVHDDRYFLFSAYNPVTIVSPFRRLAERAKTRAAVNWAPCDRECCETFPLYLIALYPRSFIFVLSNESER